MKRLTASAIATLGLALPLAPPPATAHQQFQPTDCGPAWCHMHTRYYNFLNETNDGGTIWGETRDAQLDWNNNVGLAFPSVSAHDSSRIHAIDNSAHDQHQQLLREHRPLSTRRRNQRGSLWHAAEGGRTLDRMRGLVT